MIRAQAVEVDLQQVDLHQLVVVVDKLCPLVRNKRPLPLLNPLHRNRVRVRRRFLAALRRRKKSHLLPVHHRAPVPAQVQVQAAVAARARNRICDASISPHPLQSRFRFQ